MACPDDDALARGFPVTRHSALAAARSEDAAERTRGLEVLSSVYWRPVYGYLRLHWRKPHEEASDLTQEFFAQLIDNDLLARFDAGRARLRTYLRTCIDGLVANEAKAAGRLKRGGGMVPISFDFHEARAEIERQAGTAESPEALFEKQWARSVFATALGRLRAECQRQGKSQQFALLEQYDLGPDRRTYAELAGDFGIAVTDVTNRLAWARRELRRTVLEVLRELTGSDAEFREEALALLGSDR
jgi:RNA polymerase sigma factor (sigma-70 family)